MKRRLLAVLSLVSIVSLAACKQATETIVEKGVSASKETVKGIEEGVDKGRKNGESLDGAVIVSNAEELKDKGSLSIYAVNRTATEGTAEVVVAAENTQDRPLRLTKLEFSFIDKEGATGAPPARRRSGPARFAKKAKSVSPHTDVTIPAKAKEKITITVDERADKLAKMRVYGGEYDVAKLAPPPSSSKATAAAKP